MEESDAHTEELLRILKYSELHEFDGHHYAGPRYIWCCRVCFRRKDHLIHVAKKEESRMVRREA